MSTTTTTTLAGLVMVVGAALAYTRFGIKEGDTRVDVDEDEGVVKDGEDVGEGGEAKDGARKGRQRRKAKGDVGDDDKGNAKGEDKGREKAKARGDVDAATAVPGIPGDFDAVGSATGAGTGSQDAAASPAGTGKTEGKKRRKKKKGSRAHQGKAPDGHGEGDGHKAGDEEGGEDDGSETDKEVQASGRTVSRALRSGDSTDADAPLSLSRSPSASASVLRGPRAVGKGNPGAPMGTRLAIPPSQPRAIRPSLSFDTDSSWTHVDPRRFKTHMSGDAMEVASSDLASTESSSPVAERTEGVADDIRGTRANLAQRTLAEKLVPRPEATGVDDMLEQPNVPTLARVIRVQPRAGETPMPGFSWEDYGDVVEESVLVHDADQEDEGEWGIVQSRHRTRPAQTLATTTTTTATSTPASQPDTMTQKQRQNARKRQLAKAVKADTEAARLEGLAKHKRELERLRIIEQSRQGGGKRPSGGMQATVDDRGKLVWE